MDSASARMTMVLELIRERHLDPNLASWAALAMFPFDDDVRAGRRFRKAVTRLADSYADELAQSTDDQIEELTLAAVEQLHTLAADEGETYYADHFGKVLTAASDPQTPTLERKCSGCGRWFEGFEKECASCGTKRKMVTREFEQAEDHELDIDLCTKRLADAAQRFITTWPKGSRSALDKAEDDYISALDWDLPDWVVERDHHEISATLHQLLAGASGYVVSMFECRSFEELTALGVQALAHVPEEVEPRGDEASAESDYPG